MISGALNLKDSFAADDAIFRSFVIEGVRVDSTLAHVLHVVVEGKVAASGYFDCFVNTSS